MRRERVDHTLQPTALVHEAYLKLIDQTSVSWQNRAHFFGVAAQIDAAHSGRSRALSINARSAAANFRSCSSNEEIDKAVEISAEVLAARRSAARFAKSDPARQARRIALFRRIDVRRSGGSFGRFRHDGEKTLETRAGVAFRQNDGRRMKFRERLRFGVRIFRRGF
jgi:hypothetical protein